MWVATRQLEDVILNSKHVQPVNDKTMRNYLIVLQNMVYFAYKDHLWARFFGRYNRFGLYFVVINEGELIVLLNFLFYYTLSINGFF